MSKLTLNDIKTSSTSYFGDPRQTIGSTSGSITIGDLVLPTSSDSSILTSPTAYPGTWTTSGSGAITTKLQMRDEYYTKKEVADKIRQRAIEAREQLRTLEKELEEIEECKFNTGDPAFHKKLGNVIVRGFSEAFGTTTKIIQANVVGAFEGTKTVPLDELLPLNEMTKVLYKDPNKD